LAGFLVQRIRMEQKRFSQECVRSTTPAPCLGSGAPLGPDLLATSAQVQREPELACQCARLVIVEALVEAEVRKGTARRLGLLIGVASSVGRISLVVVAVRALDHCTQRDAASVGQHRALDPALAGIRWIGPGFLPRPAAPCLWRRRVRANSSRCPAACHRPAIPCARTPGTPRPLSIPESAGAPRKTSRASSPAAHSTGSPAQNKEDGVHRRPVWHPWVMTAQRVLRPWW
jgi:hypothetical protein